MGRLGRCAAARAAAVREAARASALAPSRDASPTTVLQCIEPRILTAPSRRDALGKLLAEQLRVDTRRRAHRVRRILGRARSARTVRRGNACAEVRGSCSASKLGVIVALLHTSRRPHREQSTERVSRPSAYLVGRPAISFARPTWRGAAGMESCGLGKKCDLRAVPFSGVTKSIVLRDWAGCNGWSITI